MSFHARLQEARKAKALTGEQVGYKVGVTKATISKWENGTHDPSIHQIQALCNVLEVTPDWLFEVEKDPLPPDAMEEARAFAKLDQEGRRKWKALRKAMFTPV